MAKIWPPVAAPEASAIKVRKHQKITIIFNLVSLSHVYLILLAVNMWESLFADAHTVTSLSLSLHFFFFPLLYVLKARARPFLLFLNYRTPPPYILFLSYYCIYRLITEWPRSLVIQPFDSDHPPQSLFLYTPVVLRIFIQWLQQFNSLPVPAKCSKRQMTRWRCAQQKKQQGLVAVITWSSRHSTTIFQSNCRDTKDHSLMYCKGESKNKFPDDIRDRYLYTVAAESFYTCSSKIRLFTVYWRMVLAYGRGWATLFARFFIFYRPSLLNSSS